MNIESRCNEARFLRGFIKKIKEKIKWPPIEFVCGEFSLLYSLCFMISKRFFMLFVKSQSKMYIELSLKYIRLSNLNTDRMRLNFKISS